LRPGSEWNFDSRGWFVVRVAHGAGYMLSDEAAHELNEGDVLSGRSSAPVRFRCSQLTSTRLQFFCVYPELLGGVLTLATSRERAARLRGMAEWARIVSAHVGRSHRLRRFPDQAGPRIDQAGPQLHEVGAGCDEHGCVLTGVDAA